MILAQRTKKELKLENERTQRREQRKRRGKTVEDEERMSYEQCWYEDWKGILQRMLSSEPAAKP